MGGSNESTLSGSGLILYWVNLVIYWTLYIPFHFRSERSAQELVIPVRSCNIQADWILGDTWFLVRMLRLHLFSFANKPIFITSIRTYIRILKDPWFSHGSNIRR